MAEGVLVGHEGQGPAYGGAKPENHPERTAAPPLPPAPSSPSRRAELRRTQHIDWAEHLSRHGPGGWWWNTRAPGVFGLLMSRHSP